MSNFVSSRANPKDCRRPSPPQTNLHSVIIIVPCYIALMGVVSNVQHSVLRQEKADTYYGSLDTHHIGRFAAAL
jgi:hypothetical protein